MDLKPLNNKSTSFYLSEESRRIIDKINKKTKVNNKSKVMNYLIKEAAKYLKIEV